MYELYGGLASGTLSGLYNAKSKRRGPPAAPGGPLTYVFNCSCGSTPVPSTRFTCPTFPACDESRRRSEADHVDA